MRKNILAFAAVIMATGTITFVACNKENDTKQGNAPAAMNAKGGEALGKLCNVMVAYYEACDNAYANDSTAFLKACWSSDSASFLNLTGITDELLSAYCERAQQLLVGGEMALPDLNPGDTLYVFSRDGLLPQLGALASVTSGHLSALVPSWFDDAKFLYLTKCIDWTGNVTSVFNRVAYISVCMAKYLNRTFEEAMGYGIAQIKSKVQDEGFDFAMAAFDGDAGNTVTYCRISENYYECNEMMGDQEVVKEYYFEENGITAIPLNSTDCEMHILGLSTEKTYVRLTNLYFDNDVLKFRLYVNENCLGEYLVLVSDSIAQVCAKANSKKVPWGKIVGELTRPIYGGLIGRIIDKIGEASMAKDCLSAYKEMWNSCIMAGNVPKAQHQVDENGKHRNCTIECIPKEKQ